MYSQIVNPKTGLAVSLNSSLGKRIVKNYEKKLLGGGKRGKAKKKKLKVRCSICKQLGHNKSTCPHNHPWNCAVCTFRNTENMQQCEICTTKRVFKKPKSNSEAKRRADATPLPLAEYNGPGPYIEEQVSHNCAVHSINHILQEDKVELGNLDNLWTPDHLIPPANRGGSSLTNPYKKLRMHYCALEAARREALALGMNSHIDRAYLENSGFFDYKDGNWTINSILYALNEVFNFKTDVYYNHGGKIWTGDGEPKRSVGNPPSTLMADIANPDLIGFILNIHWSDSSGTIHRHFIALHNRWNGCHPGGDKPNQFTYLESILSNKTRKPVWGCGSFTDIMNWADSEYSIPGIIAIFKKRDATGIVISYNCPGCN